MHTQPAQTLRGDVATETPMGGCLHAHCRLSDVFVCVRACMSSGWPVEPGTLSDAHTAGTRTRMNTTQHACSMMVLACLEYRRVEEGRVVE